MSIYTFPEVKIAVFGDCGVGKTTFIDKFRKYQFSPLFNKILYKLFPYASIGTRVNAYIKEFYDCNDSIIPDVIIVIFDLTNKKSYDNIFNNWIPYLEKHYIDIPICIVGNKYDLINKSEYIFNNIYPYYEISAEQGLTNLSA